MGKTERIFEILILNFLAYFLTFTFELKTLEQQQHSFQG